MTTGSTPGKNHEWKRVRKKPVEVLAKGPLTESVEIETLEGTLVAAPGDYLIKGVEGEVYPIDQRIFHATYEELE